MSHLRKGGGGALTHWNTFEKYGHLGAQYPTCNKGDSRPRHLEGKWCKHCLVRQTWPFFLWPYVIRPTLAICNFQSKLFCKKKVNMQKTFLLSALCNGEIMGPTLSSSLVGLFV